MSASLNFLSVRHARQAVVQVVNTEQAASRSIRYRGADRGVRRCANDMDVKKAVPAEIDRALDRYRTMGTSS